MSAYHFVQLLCSIQQKTVPIIYHLPLQAAIITHVYLLEERNNSQQHSLNILFSKTTWVVSKVNISSSSCIFRKGKEEYLYSAILYTVHLKVLSHESHSFACKYHACLSFVSVYQMAPPLTELTGIQLQLTTHLLTPKGWKAELAWLVDQRTVYPHKWSPVSYRSSAGQGKFAGQRPAFYRCATNLSIKWVLLAYWRFAACNGCSYFMKQRYHVWIGQCGTERTWRCPCRSMPVFSCHGRACR